MNKINTFITRIKKLGIEIELMSNYPWLYLDRINGKRVTEKFYAEHGFTIMFRGKDEEFLDISEMFKIIRKYAGCEICGAINYHKMSCPKIKTVIII